MSSVNYSPAGNGTDRGSELVDAVKRRLAEWLDKDDQGRPRLTVTLPDESALDDLANALARMLEMRT